MTSINETDFEEEHHDTVVDDHLFHTSKEYYRIEENLKRIHFLLVDYLAEMGRRDLFKSLTLTDLAAMIYNPSYIRELIRDRPDCLL